MKRDKAMADRVGFRVSLLLGAVVCQLGAAGAALADDRFVTVRGVCVEAERDGSGNLVRTQRPIAGAQVWLAVLRQEGDCVTGVTPRDPANRSRARYRAVSGPDGTWVIENVPRFKGIQANMAHPDYVCELQNPFGIRPPLAPGVVRTKRHGGKAPLATAWRSRKGKPLRLAAERGVPLRGVVRAADGRVVVGATITAWDSTSRQTLQTLTGAGGVFRLAGFPPGARLRLEVRAPGCRPFSSEVELDAGVTNTVELRLDAGGTIHALFVGREGRKLEGLRVELEKHSADRSFVVLREGRLDEAGRASFTDLEPDQTGLLVVRDAKGTRLVQEWVTASCAGTRLTLTEMRPTRLTLGVDPAAGDTSWRLFLVSPTNCLGSFDRTLKEAGTFHSGRPLTAERPRLTMAVRGNAPLRALAIPEALATRDRMLHGTYTQEELSRMRISGVFRCALRGERITVVADQPLVGGRLKGAVSQRAGYVSLRPSGWAGWSGSVMSGAPIARAKVGPDGAFAFGGLVWPGRYELIWHRNTTFSPRASAHHRVDVRASGLATVRIDAP